MGTGLVLGYRSDGFQVFSSFSCDSAINEEGGELGRVGEWEDRWKGQTREEEMTRHYADR